MVVCVRRGWRFVFLEGAGEVVEFAEFGFAADFGDLGIEAAMGEVEVGCHAVGIDEVLDLARRDGIIDEGGEESGGDELGEHGEGVGGEGAAEAGLCLAGFEQANGPGVVVEGGEADSLFAEGEVFVDGRVGARSELMRASWMAARVSGGTLAGIVDFGESGLTGRE
ncbi:MAG: hypothetical protein IPK83_11410 [Planctomycetes bacterium]|nr:hypothetical protein [Planctomycetota bacterium]